MKTSFFLHGEPMLGQKAEGRQQALAVQKMGLRCTDGRDALSLSSEDARLGIASLVVGLFQLAKSQGAVHVPVVLHLSPTAPLVTRMVHDSNMIHSSDVADMPAAHLPHVEPTGDVLALTVYFATDRAFRIAKAMRGAYEVLGREQ